METLCRNRGVRTGTRSRELARGPASASQVSICGAISSRLRTSEGSCRAFSPVTREYLISWTTSRYSRIAQCLHK